MRHTAAAWANDELIVARPIIEDEGLLAGLLSQHNPPPASLPLEPRRIPAEYPA